MDDESYEIGDSFEVQRALSHGFAAIRVAAGPMWVAGLLMSISDCGGGGMPSNFSNLAQLPFRGRSHVLLSGAKPGLRSIVDQLERNGSLGAVVSAVIALIVAGLVFGFLLFALNCWATTGFIRLQVNVLEHASEEIAPLFTGRDRFWPMVGYKLLAGFSASAVALAAAAPGGLVLFAGALTKRGPLVVAGIGLIALLAIPAVVYVALGTYLGEHCVVLESATPVNALRRSFALAHGNRMPLLAFALVCWLVQVASTFAGLLLCCIGIIGTVPFGRSLVGFAKTEGFLLYTRGKEGATQYKLWQRLAQEDRVDRVEGWGDGRPPPPPQAGAT